MSDTIHDAFLFAPDAEHPKFKKGDPPARYPSVFLSDKLAQFAKNRLSPKNQTYQKVGRHVQAH